MESVYSAQVAVERMFWVLSLAKRGKRNFKCVEVTNKLLTKEGKECCMWKPLFLILL